MEQIHGTKISITHEHITLQTPLHLATREGHFDCVQTLVEYGARMDIRNRSKKTAEMLLTNPEHIRKFQSIIAKSKSKKIVREERKGSVKQAPPPSQQNDELHPPLKPQLDDNLTSSSEGEENTNSTPPFPILLEVCQDISMA